MVDGGSTDRTCEVAAAHGARVIQAERGRGLQLRTGAEAASGDVLLFLHSDSKLPERWGFAGSCSMDLEFLHYLPSFI